MTFITEGYVVTFLTELAFCIILWITISRAKQGLKLPYIRKVGGLDAIDEAIGRATEMGRPVHFGPGLSDVNEAQTLAAMGILDYVATKTARQDVPLIVTNNKIMVQSVSEEIVKNAYTMERKQDSYNPDNVRYLSDQQFGYATGVTGILRREKAATNILIGAFWAESLIFTQTGYEIGAIQIAGTANTHQIPFFVASCDYCLMGDEIYAASAYLTQESVLLGSLVASDWVKIGLIFVLIIGAGFIFTGNDGLAKLLKR